MNVGLRLVLMGHALICLTPTRVNAQQVSLAFTVRHEVDDCASKPCYNGSSCYDVGLHYLCVCLENYHEENGTLDVVTTLYILCALASVALLATIAYIGYLRSVKKLPGAGMESNHPSACPKHNLEYEITDVTASAANYGPVTGVSPIYDNCDMQMTTKMSEQRSTSRQWLEDLVG